jgi:putative oxidoreductase
MNKFSIMIGQFLLGLYFFAPGIRKFTTSDKLLAYMQSHDIAFASQLLWFAGAVSVIGGLLLMSGRHVKLVAYGFVVYVLLVNLMLHDFWTMSEDVAPREMQNFIKNLAIMSGLLAVAGYASSRRLSLEGWWKSDKSLQR